MFRLVYRKHPIIGKFIFTLLILVVFIIGRYIPLPNTALGSYLAEEDSVLNMGAMISGGSLSQIGLFSLGLGPWMYAMILVRLFAIGKKKKPVSGFRQTARQSFLMLIIGLIQGLSFALNLKYTGSQEMFWGYVFEATLILIAGAYILYWLGNQNSEYGFGGPTAIVLINMLLGQKSAFETFGELFSQGYYVFPIFLVIWSLIMLYMNVVFERAEYRIPVRRVSINNELANEAYMPIKVNIAGGMPFMYAYSFLMLPQYLNMLLRYFYPDVADWGQLSSYFTTTTLSGVAIYVTVIFLLSLSFAFVNLDPQSQAEGMRNSGDYIENVRPGKATQTYLSKIVMRMATFYGIYLAIVVAVPTVLALGDKDYMQIAAITGVLLMISGMIIGVLQEISIARLKKGYRSLFERG